MQKRVVYVQDDEQIQKYTGVIRQPGMGELRIGTKIQLSEDLYSMLFVTCFHPEYIVYCEKVKSSDDRDFNQIIERQKERE